MDAHSKSSQSAAVQRLAFSLAETASALGVCRGLIYAMIERGELKTIRLGRRRLVPLVELERLTQPPGAAA